MTEKQVYTEIQKFLESQVDLIQERNYYTELHLRIVEEQNRAYKSLIDKSEFDQLTEDEKNKLRIDLRQQEAQTRAANEVITALQKLNRRVSRKYEEQTKKLEKFCKQHGLDINKFARCES